MDGKKEVENMLDDIVDMFVRFPTFLPGSSTLKDKPNKTEDEIKLLNLVKNEGDGQEWYCKTSKYHCIIKRNLHSGFWLGYVGVPDNHPCYKMGYDDVHEKHDEISVHGGLTYAGWHPDDQTWNEPPHYLSRNEKYWYLGFDCGHAYDMSPYDVFGSIRIPMEKYRTKGYVKKEVNSLAKQLFSLQNIT